MNPHWDDGDDPGQDPEPEPAGAPSDGRQAQAPSGGSTVIGTQHVHGGAVGVEVGGLSDQVGPRYGRFVSNLPDLGDTPFVGREPDLEALGRYFAEPGRHRVLVLRGHPGVGKTTLAQRFARQARAGYPGGVFMARVDSLAPPVELAGIGVALGLAAAADLSLEGRCRRVLATLGQAPTLLIYDDVPGPRVLDAWAPSPAGRCHVLVTSTYEAWMRRAAHELAPLDGAQSAALVEMIVGPGADAATAGARQTLIARAGGLPVELAAVAYAMARDARRGRVRVRDDLHRDTVASFERVWTALPERARLALGVAALFAPQPVPEGELVELLEVGAALGPGEAEDAIEACRCRHLLHGGRSAADGRVVLGMHGLMAAFVRERQGPDAPVFPLALVEAYARLAAPRPAPRPRSRPRT